MIDPINPFQVEFSLLKDLEVQRDAQKQTYNVIATFKKPEYFDENVLISQNIPYNISDNKKTVTILNWKAGQQLFRSWLSYINNSSKNNVYQAKINLITTLNNEEDHSEVIVKNIVLNSDLNRTLQDLCAILAMDDPIYYKNDKGNIDMDKVFRFLIVTGLQNLHNSGDLTVAQTMGDSIGKRVATMIQEDANVNLLAIRQRDENLGRLWNYTFVVLNQILNAILFLINDSNLNLSNITKSKIKQLILDPFIKNTDPDKLFTGNESMRKYVDYLYNQLNNIDPKDLKMQIETSVDDSETQSYSNSPKEIKENQTQTANNSFTNDPYGMDEIDNSDDYVADDE